MTVEAGYPIQPFPGGQSSYQTTIPYEQDADLLIEVVKIDDGTRTRLRLGIDYTLMSGGRIEFIDNGADWIFLDAERDVNLSARYRIIFRRLVTIEQQTSLENQGPFFAETHEKAFDKLTEVDQQQQHDLESSIKIVDRDGNAAGGTLTKQRDSIIAFNNDSELVLIEHDEEVITGEKVDDLADDLRDLEREVGTTNPQSSTSIKAILGTKDDEVGDDTAFGRIEREKDARETSVTNLSRRVTALAHLPGGRIKIAFWTALRAGSILPSFDPADYSFTVTQAENPKKITHIVAFTTSTGSGINWEYGWGPTSATRHDVFRQADHTTYLYIGEAYIDSDGNYQVDKAAFETRPIRVFNHNNVIGDVTTAMLNTKISHALVPVRLYRRFTQTEMGDGTFTAASAALVTDNPISTINFNHGSRAITTTLNGDSGYNYYTPTELQAKIALGGFLYYIEAFIEFDAHETNSDILEGVVFNWMQVPILHDSVQNRKIAELEARPTGGGGVAVVLASGLRVISVNDGLDLLDGIETIPDTMAITLRTDAIVHSPITIRIQGLNTDIATSKGGDGLAAGAAERITFPITDAQKTHIERNLVQSNNGTAVMYVYGAKSTGGSVGRLASFAIHIKNSLAPMIGPRNRNEILVNGLPALLPNIIQTVLSNLRARHRAIQIFGGVGNPSVNLGTAMSQENFNQYLNADWLYLTLDAAKASVTSADLSTTNTDAEHVRVPLESMNRTTGDLFYRMHFYSQRNNNLNQNYVEVTVVGSTRVINARGNNVGSIGPAIISAVAYVPTYSFSPAGNQLVGEYSGTHDTDPVSILASQGSPAWNGATRYPRTLIQTSQSSARSVFNTPDQGFLTQVRRRGLYVMVWRADQNCEILLSNTSMWAKALSPPYAVEIEVFRNGTVVDSASGDLGTTRRFALIPFTFSKTAFDLMPGDFVAITHSQGDVGFLGLTLNIEVKQTLPGYTAP